MYFELKNGILPTVLVRPIRTYLSPRVEGKLSVLPIRIYVLLVHTSCLDITIDGISTFCPEIMRNLTFYIRENLIKKYITFLSKMY